MKYCVCGHTEASHTMRIFDPSGYPRKMGCSTCEFVLFNNGNIFNEIIHDFKLDSLKLIEDLAKERKLI